MPLFGVRVRKVRWHSWKHSKYGGILRRTISMPRRWILDAKEVLHSAPHPEGSLGCLNKAAQIYLIRPCKGRKSCLEAQSCRACIRYLTLHPPPPSAPAQPTVCAPPPPKPEIDPVIPYHLTLCLSPPFVPAIRVRAITSTFPRFPRGTRGLTTRTLPTLHLGPKPTFGRPP